ncbi:MAG: M48 family metallopeptidase [Synergistaceae bacterium]|nr:M48 family metallopeptidase [Synergistaceae bacterium]
MNNHKIITVGEFVLKVFERSRQKHMYIRVMPPNGDLIASVPSGTPDNAIRDLVLSKAVKIIKIQDKFRSQYRQSRREYVSGETFYYWGVPHMLQVNYFTEQPSKFIKHKIEIVPNKIIMRVHEGTSRDRRRTFLTEHLRFELDEMVRLLLPEYERKFAIKLNRFMVRNMKTRWGSCNIRERNIMLNLQLVTKPLICLEFVLHHEFVHFFERLHNNRFKRILSAYYPNWREADQLMQSMPLECWEK